MRLGTFWKTFYNTITNPKYYIDVLNVRMWFTVRFLICSYVLLTLIGALIFAFNDVPKLDHSLNAFLTKTVEEFPAGQQLSWDGLKVKTTLPESYTLAFPNLPDAQGTPALLVQVDPNVENVDQISQPSDRQSMFFVGQTSLFMSQPGGGWSELPLSDVLSTDAFTIDKNSLTSGLQSYRDQLQRTLRALPFLFAAFFFLVSFPLRVVNVLLDSIFIYLLVKLAGLPLTFKKISQISLHVMVAAELISILTANVSRDLSMFTIAFWGYTFLIYWQLRNIKAFKLSELQGHQEKG